jgi:hypothetical protein
MSTHDMYFSKQNKNHIFNIIQDLVLKETGIDINDNKEYIDLYRFKYPLIFERSTSDNLIDINKELIDEIGILLINDITNKYQKEKDNPKKEIKSDTKEIIVKEKFKTELHLNSSDNIYHNNNRYDYFIKVPNKLEFKIKEIIIPVENNILFTNPIIFINVNNTKIKFSFINLITMNNLEYNIYKPIEEIIIKNNKNFIKIEIINNLNMKILDENDKIEINKIKEIEIENKNYLAIKIINNHNLKENNTITIYDKNKAIKTMIISKIVNDILLFENQTIETEDNNLFLINTNLQNNITICL